jgi:hypothetical protein
MSRMTQAGRNFVTQELLATHPLFTFNFLL